MFAWGNNSDRASVDLKPANFADKVSLLDPASPENGLRRADRLREFRRGILSGDKKSVATASRSQSWRLDALGNWASNTLDGTAQARSHNPANEITDLSDTANDPNYDSRGNMTADANLLYKYDAWNRLAEVRRRADNSLTATYKHDGTNRRIRKFLPAEGGDANVTYDYYYDFQWRLVEVRKNGSGSPYEQYVWSPRYIDAAVLRDRDVGSLERLYYLTDAQQNVTALTDPNGQVVERYLYDAYGQPTFLDANRSPITWSNSRKNEILFCGYRYDPETGNYQVRNRCLIPGLGRWTQRDPSGFADGMDLYQYVQSNPIAYVDLDGAKGAPPASQPASAPAKKQYGLLVSSKDDDDTKAFRAGLTLQRNFGSRIFIQPSDGSS